MLEPSKVPEPHPPGSLGLWEERSTLRARRRGPRGDGTSTADGDSHRSSVAGKAAEDHVVTRAASEHKAKAHPWVVQAIEGPSGAEWSTPAGWKWVPPALHEAITAPMSESTSGDSSSHYLASACPHRVIQHSSSEIRVDGRSVAWSDRWDRTWTARAACPRRANKPRTIRSAWPTSRRRRTRSSIRRETARRARRG